MSSADQDIHRIAKQHLKTSMLMGVDFIPVNNDMEMDMPQETTEPPDTPPTVKVMSEAVQVVLDPSNKKAALDALKVLHDRECPHCSNATGYTQTVFGEGNPDADLMFIGEAPGADEDRTGRPFVGRAGKKLNDIIAAMQLKREDVYIANILKARPPDNRTPQPDEVAMCSPYLVEQMRIIQPKVIVTLGGPSTKLMLDTKEGITKIRGIWAVYRDGETEIPIMPTFHPAFLLRNYTKDTRQKVWSDMKAVLEKLEEIK